jgi:tetratricopeptide (TPR) repeat protein
VELVDVPFFPQTEHECGPAALATVLGYSGVHVLPADLTPAVYLPGRQGSLQLELIAAARRYGRIPYAPQPAFSALLAQLRAGYPVLVLQNLGVASLPVWHYAVVVAYDRPLDTVVLRSGRDEHKATTASEFMRTWTLADRWALVTLVPGELPAQPDVDAYLRAVAAMERMSDARMLVTAYQVAVDRWPDNFVAGFGLANALSSAGQLARAERAYRNLLNARPEHPAVLNNLADVLARQGCYEEAAQALDVALASGSATEQVRAVLMQTREEVKASRSRVTNSGGASVCHRDY